MQHRYLLHILAAISLIFTCSCSESPTKDKGESNDGNICTRSALQQKTTELSPLYHGTSIQLAGTVGDTAIIIDVLAPEIQGITPDGKTHHILTPEEALDFKRNVSTIVVNAKANHSTVAWALGGELIAFDRNTHAVHLLLSKADSFSIRYLALHSQYVYFDGSKGTESPHLWRIPIQGGTPEVVIDDFSSWSWYMLDNGRILKNGQSLVEYDPEGNKLGTIKPGFYVSDSRGNGSTIAYRSSTGSLYTANAETPTEVSRSLNFGDEVYGFIAEGANLFGTFSVNLVHANSGTGVCIEYTDIQPMQIIPANGNLWVIEGFSLYMLKY